MADTTQLTDDVAVGAATCAVSHRAGSSGIGIVMAPGLGVPRKIGTEPFASSLHAAGHSTVTFDYRAFGTSTGSPRGVVSIRRHLQDWSAVIAWARKRSDIEMIVAWGFSLSGAIVLQVAAEAGVDAAISICPNADGRAAAKNASRHATTGSSLRLVGRAVADQFGGWLGASPRLVATAGQRGDVALLTTPDALGSIEAFGLDSPGSPPPEMVAARFALRAPFFRPITRSASISVPLLVITAADDCSALAAPGRTSATRAPNGHHVEVPGSHYSPFTTGVDAAVATQIEFLSRATR